MRDIRVEGIQRTEAGTVFNYLPVRVGESFNEDKAAQAIKALFATGFFKDVRIEVEGDVLVVVLEERPAIASLEFTGMAYQPWIGLPNILAGKDVVPELLQHDATPDRLADALDALLGDAVARRAQLDEFEQIHHTLRQDTAARAAEAILPHLPPP